MMKPIKLFAISRALRAVVVSLLMLPAISGVAQDAWNNLPIRALLLSAPDHDDVQLFCKFVRDALPKEGVNTLVVRFGYRYQFASHPELAAYGALSKDE